MATPASSQSAHTSPHDYLHSKTKIPVEIVVSPCGACPSAMPDLEPAAVLAEAHTSYVIVEAIISSAPH